MSVCCLKSILQMVSVSILLKNASSADVDCDKNNPLPRPTLALDPPSSVILPGEEVSLVCHFPLTSCNVDIYRNHKERLYYVNEVNYTAKVKLEADRKWKDNDAYTCQYVSYFENNRTWACSPHSDPVQLIVTEVLQWPTASVDSASRVFTVGEQVHFNCVTNYPSRISHLYRGPHNEPIDSGNVPVSDWSVIFTITELETNDTGNYSCGFEQMVKGTDRLPKPTVSIQPVSGVVTVGERVQLNCTTSYPSPISHVYKKYGKKPVESRNVSGSERSVIFTMKDLEPEDSGEYSCSFEKTVKGGIYESYRSNHVEVNLTATLPMANISVDPPSGVVSGGSTIRITCTGSILNPGGCFRLYRDGEENRALDISGPQQSATFTIPDTDTGGTWNYTCLYTRRVKETFYQSPRSDAVQVTVKNSNLLFIRWCLAAVILFGTVIVLGIECNHMERKKDSDGHVTDGIFTVARGSEETAV